MKRIEECRHYLSAKPNRNGRPHSMTLCHAAVCSHSLVVDRWGHSWESCAPRLSMTRASRLNPLLGLLSDLLRSATAHEVSKQRENCEVENTVRKDGDAEEPAKRPCERFAGLWSNKFCQLQPRRKKSDNRCDHLWLKGHSNGQREKPCKQAKHGEQDVTERPVLCHCR
jgi:hypothetical protein